ncbi:hypothetical protein DVH05_007327 [Phytophthora capsici]|nr:hypothetical protein DVH05_007327 [Phytophthora capsici]
MAKSQQFLQDPRLALAYYHCCGVDPDSFVFGDERIAGEFDATRLRIAKLLEDCPGPSDIASCQRSVESLASEATSIWACASCGRVLLQNTAGQVYFASLDDLRPSVKLTDDELDKIYQSAPKAMVQRYRQLLYIGEEVFYLIPELVRDVKKIPLCQKCYTNPRSCKFSVASGHDYGRIGQLPSLNDVSLACITPTRCFGLELSLSGKHSSGHAICFPTNGPNVISRTLPNIDPECAPRVTFIGPMETWRIHKKKFLKLFEISADSVYKWLAVLARVNNVFIDEGIEIVDNPRRREFLRELEASIQSEVCIADSTVVSGLDQEAGSEFGERDNGCVSTAGMGTGDVFVRGSAVLPQVDQSDSAVVHEIIDAMVEAVGGDAGSVRQETPVIPIKRARSPFVEWEDNAKILATVFPNMFLTGSGPLPSGSLPRDYVDHFMHYWDGRFERSRHAAVRKAARVGVTHGETMEKFGKLINTTRFKEALAFAKANPDSKEASRLNSGLLRFLALVGGSVPFSPFERAATRPKLGAMRYRYGPALHWVTVAPPEHDDLLLHRIAQLRVQGLWNDASSVFGNKSCRFTDMPEMIQNDARSRLAVSAQFPALSAQVFERKMKLLTDAILRCRDSSSTRASVNYLEVERGVYGRCAAFNAVIEPQRDGRLHAHMTVYGSAINPSLLTRVVSCPDLVAKARRYVDSVCCTTITAATREWCGAWKEARGIMPRAFEILVPDASSNYEGFLNAAEKRVFSTNIHSHSGTCRKGIRGRTVCRLSRPAGIHEDITQPIFIRLTKASVLGKRQRAEFSVSPVSTDIARHVDAAMDYSAKRVVREHLNGAIVWEQRRPREDSMFVETNLPLACLSASHTNSAIMNSEDAADMVEEYQQSYMTKEQGGLKSATAVMHVAISHILKYPSVAEDSGTALRQAKHLATRTVNAFSGGNEWSHSLMAYALAGYRSYMSSDTFWYVFPGKLVAHAEELASLGSGSPGPQTADADDDGTTGGDRSIHDELEEIANRAGAGNEPNSSTGCTNSRARMYRVAGETIVVTQAVSYQHRGPLFEEYSPLEFEMIVDLLPRTDHEERSPSKRGRPKRRGFDLGPGHPLSPHFQGFIRAKFQTPMLGGPPPPSIKKNGQPPNALSKYLICLLTPWARDGRSPPRDLSPRALIQLCKKWNSISARFIDRQRYRYMHNILQKLSRSSQNEKVCSEWRSRNTDFWGASIACPPAPTGFNCEGTGDALEDRAGSAEIYDIAVAVSAKNNMFMNVVRALKSDFWAMIPGTMGTSTRPGPQQDPIYRNHLEDGTNLTEMIRSIHAMRSQTGDSKGSREENNQGRGPIDTFGGTAGDEGARARCSSD